MSRKKGKGLIIFIVLLCVFGTYAVIVNNNLTKKEEAVKASWSQVANQYTRRLSLIPNLVETVKAYARHEQETLDKVITARSMAGSLTPDEQNLNPETVQSYLDAQDQLTSALSRLMVTVEAYPDLKASESFIVLQAQLEGTENRISIERRRFIENTRAYNTYYRSFPTKFMGKLLGFSELEYFTAAEGAEKAVEVDF